MNNILLCTHSGAFHADDVLSSAILCSLFKVKPEAILRTRDIKEYEEIRKKYSVDIAYDVFNGLLDHHKLDDEMDITAPDRKLASVGKIWRFFKDSIMDYFGIDEESWEHIDQSYIKPVDIADNGGDECELSSYISSIMSDYGSFKEFPYNTPETLQAYFIDAVKEEQKRFNTVIRKEHRQTVDRAKFYQEAAEHRPIEINGKIFAYFSNKEWHIGRKNDFYDGVLNELPNGHFKFYFFNNLGSTKKGISEGEEEGVIFVHKTGFCGEVEYFDKLKEII